MLLVLHEHYHEYEGYMDDNLPQVSIANPLAIGNRMRLTEESPQRR